MPKNGDPRYLQLLDYAQEQLLFNADSVHSTQIMWDVFDASWDMLDFENPAFNHHIFDIGVMALDLYCRINKQDPVTVIEAMRSLHIRKNAGYAGHDQDDPWLNFRGSVKWNVPPEIGVLIRLGDKYIRTVNLRRDPNNEQVGESLLDSLADFAAYAFIEVCIEEETRNADLVPAL